MKDYRATFDFSDADWAAVDKALAVLEDKFSRLREITPEDLAWQIPFSTRAEAFCRKAVDVMVKDRDVLIDTDVDLDEIRGDLLSIDELRPRIGRLAALLDKCRHNESVLKYSVCRCPRPVWRPGTLVADHPPKHPNQKPERKKGLQPQADNRPQ